MRRMVATAGAAMAMVLGTASAAAAEDDGWHTVHEPWEPYVDGGLLLPAERYCGDFDLRSTPTHQDIRSRVLTRWDSGGARTVTYAGPLLVTATNKSTGQSADLNLSGSATATYDEAGAFDLYETKGPVAVGFPVGSNSELEPGMYLLTGHHVIDFEPDGSRTLVVDQGSETNICNLVS